MVTRVIRPTGITTIGPTPIILIPDTIRIVLIWDGADIGGITAITTIIGVSIGQATTTKAVPIAINANIIVVTTVKTVETIVDIITMDANGGDKSIVRTGGSIGRMN